MNGDRMESAFIIACVCAFLLTMASPGILAVLAVFDYATNGGQHCHEPKALRNPSVGE